MWRKIAIINIEDIFTKKINFHISQNIKFTIKIRNIYYLNYLDFCFIKKKFYLRRKIIFKSLLFYFLFFIFITEEDVYIFIYLFIYIFVYIQEYIVFGIYNERIILLRHWNVDRYYRVLRALKAFVVLKDNRSVWRLLGQ